MARYIEGQIVLFSHAQSSGSYLKGMVRRVVPSGDDNLPCHYNIICEELQCEVFISEDNIIDIAY